MIQLINYRISSSSLQFIDIFYQDQHQQSMHTIQRFSKKWTIRFEDIQSFSKIVGDYNAVHHDATFAAKTRFKSPIAHGMTSIVMLNHILPQNLTIKSFQIRFHKPIYPTDGLTADLEVGDSHNFELRVSKKDQIVTIVKGTTQAL